MLLSTTLTYARYAAAPEYPKTPIAKLTPGEYCSTPTEYRYREQIPYCERDVSAELKEQAFEQYRRMGFTLPKNHRSSYKIDHFIPLCAGGANTLDNLWPQHMTVFQITDRIEAIGCEKLKLGKITQRDVVGLILKAKMNLSQADSIYNQLRAIR